MLRKIFQEHPKSVGETYVEHFHSAFGFGTMMIVGGIKCVIHGFLPPMFKTSGSDAVRQLHVKMVTHRRRDTPHGKASEA
ncbi:DUF6356 family protein (plasmid) [Novosphingobium resinovorum]|uniref:DUF6356 family protein n=1 Tax=Novosphingobium TaxID=165696 RepID=UPI001B3C97F3|nr:MULTISPECIES: DUF6356 family protein [Novosphingobium]MBF7015575.1 hypothetical protein [Novosphingobium sp. HR1a]WJM30251.1 DUF6356 family protein [Novosphingobium resinovorum]